MLGFPVLSALALTRITAAHSLVWIGLLPLATATFGVLIAGERMRLAFWAFSLADAACVALFSIWIGFFFCYRGLALGGIAAVGHLQLLQPFFGLVIAAALLQEPVSAGLIAVALAILVCVAGARGVSLTPRRAG